MRIDKFKLFLTASLVLTTGALSAIAIQPGPDIDPDTDFVPVTRSLSFAAAADPQFSKNTNNSRVSFQNDIARFLLAKLYNDENYKGLIIAGDLTENTYKWEILKFYNAILPNEEDELSPILNRKKELDRLYEGLGNHDMRKGACCVVSTASEELKEAANARKNFSKSMGASVGIDEDCVCETGLTNIISRDGRQDQLRSQAPHYSWEWEGIRFVQLNLLPGNEAETVWSGSDRDPQDALKFLKNELEDAGPNKNVIVVHHYGMDKFSRKWWSEETKTAYKEVIEDYRVVAIISGHLHWSRNFSNMQQCWNGVTAVTVGSIRLGLHVDFKIVDDQLTLRRMVNGSPRWSDTYSIAQNNTEFCGSNT